MSGYKKFGWVNALRGYAILLVILIHSSQTFYVSNLIKTVSARGDLGVQLFFILSSFTLFNSYSIRRIEENKYVNRDFYIRRYFRIAPYYYIAGCIYVIYRIFIKNESVNYKNLIANYTFTNGLYLPGINDIPPGGWSVGIEMLFYLMIPILFKFINSLKKAILFFLGTLIFSIMINHYFLSITIYYIGLIWSEINPWAFYFWLPNQLPIFALGIVLYFIYKNITCSYQYGKIILVLSILLFITFSFYDFNTQYPYYFIKKEYLYGLILVAFSIGTYTTENKIISNKIIQKIGLYSFSIYLNHFLILYIIGYLYSGFNKFLQVYLNFSKILLQNDFVFFICYFCVILISYSISKYTYQNIELKGINLGNKIILNLKKKL